MQLESSVCTWAIPTVHIQLKSNVLHETHLIPLEKKITMFNKKNYSLNLLTEPIHWTFPVEGFELSWKPLLSHHIWWHPILIRFSFFSLWILFFISPNSKYFDNFLMISNWIAWIIHLNLSCFKKKMVVYWFYWTLDTVCLNAQFHADDFV